MRDVRDVSDEMLMAFADDQLSSADRDRVLAYLERNPEARARLAAFEVTRKRLPEIVNEALVGPAPDRILATIMDGAATAGSTTGAAGGSGPQRKGQSVWGGLVQSIGDLFNRMHVGLPAAALAAGALAGIVIGQHVTQNVPPSVSPGTLISLPNGTLAAAGPLASVLEDALGDKPATIQTASGTITWMAVLTFEAKDGRYCRHFTLTSADGDRSAALACRSTSGQWDVEAAEALPRTTSAPPVDLVGDDELRDKVMGMIKGEPIAGLHARDLIGRRWVK